MVVAIAESVMWIISQRDCQVIHTLAGAAVPPNSQGLAEDVAPVIAVLRGVK